MMAWRFAIQPRQIASKCDGRRVEDLVSEQVSTRSEAIVSHKTGWTGGDHHRQSFAAVIVDRVLPRRSKP
jgi:hypothetical protein